MFFVLVQCVVLEPRREENLFAWLLTIGTSLNATDMKEGPLGFNRNGCLSFFG